MGKPTKTQRNEVPKELIEEATKQLKKEQKRSYWVFAGNIIALADYFITLALKCFALYGIIALLLKLRG